MVLDDPVFRDSMGASQDSGFSYDIENQNFRDSGWFHQGSVAAVLYDIYDENRDGMDDLSVGFAPIYETLTNQAFIRDIEMPEVRQRQGKPAVGTIQLAAKQTDDCLIVCVWNNGCGSNPTAIQRRVQPYIAASMRGTVTVACLPGKGTCFTLRIPLQD